MLGRGVPVRLRSIPARAGETVPPSGYRGNAEVYPRTGGGNWSSGNNTPALTGLSPHGRGKLLERAEQVLINRSIPARAGETVARRK